MAIWMRLFNLSTNRVTLEYQGKRYGLAFEDMQSYADVESLVHLLKNTLVDIFEETTVVKVG